MRSDQSYLRVFTKQALRRIRFNLPGYVRRNGGRFLAFLGFLESQREIGQLQKARATVSREVSGTVPGAVPVFPSEVEARRNPKVLCGAVLPRFFALSRHTRIILDVPSTTLGWLLALRKTTQDGARVSLTFARGKGHPPVRTRKAGVPGIPRAQSRIQHTQ